MAVYEACKFYQNERCNHKDAPPENPTCLGKDNCGAWEDDITEYQIEGFPIILGQYLCECSKCGNLTWEIDADVFDCPKCHTKDKNIIDYAEILYKVINDKLTKVK